jgi:hypothetical protein
MADNIITELPKDKKYLLSDKFNEIFSNYPKYFGKMGALKISEETNGVNSDGHYGKGGHEVIGKLFYEHITKPNSLL